MSENSPLPAGQRTRIAMLAILRVLVRLLLIFLVAAILGVLIYIGFVTVYQQAVLPAQQNASRIDMLETRQAQDSLLLDQRLETFQQRLASLENQRTLNNDNLAGLINDQTQLQAEIDRQGLELLRLDDLQAELDNVRSYADKAYNIGIQGYQATVGKDSMIYALQREIIVLKVTSLLNRSRLYMVQNNLGLARDQVVMARGLLDGLLEEASDLQRPVLTAWIGRLDSALSNLPNSPVIAGDELEIAWKLILEGLPEQIIPTPTAYFVERSTTSTAIPTIAGTRPVLTRTATPLPVRSATPTPTPTTYRTPTP